MLIAAAFSDMACQYKASTFCNTLKARSSGIDSAKSRVPRLLAESMPEERALSVLQNVDALYWQAISENAAAISIGDRTICVFNSTPLEKYESYRICFER